MQLLVLVGMVLGLVWLAERLGFGLTDRALVVLVRGFAGWVSNPWPRGVQEEDRDRPWGATPARPAEPPPIRPGLTRVHPAVHAR